MTTISSENLYTLVSTMLETDYRFVNVITPNLPINNDPPRVVFVGTSIVGKSSLINSILRYELSPVNFVVEDHRITRETIWMNLIKFIDVSGFFEITEELISSIRRANVVIQVCDVEATVRRSDRQLKYLVSQFDKPYIAILNKIDLVKHEKKRLASLIHRSENALQSEMVCTSAKERSGLDKLVHKIYETLPDFDGQEFYSRLHDVQTRIKIEALYQRQHILLDEVITKYAHDAAKIAAGVASAGAQLLTLHRKMIHEIANQVSRDSQIVQFPTDYTFDSRLTFFTNAVIQEVTKLIPKTGGTIASAHAVVWTDNIGKLAAAYFSQQISNEEVEIYFRKEFSP